MNVYPEKPAPVRFYCDGALSKKVLAAQLEKGFVLVDVVRFGCAGGDVAYFREGTPAEIADCRRRLAESAASPTREES